MDSMLLDYTRGLVVRFIEAHYGRLVTLVRPMSVYGLIHPIATPARSYYTSQVTPLSPSASHEEL